MPVAFPLIVAGIILILATGLTTLGWVLLLVGLGLIALHLLFFVFVFSKVKKSAREFDKAFDRFGF